MPARRVVVKAEPVACEKASKRADKGSGKKGAQMASALGEFETDLAKASAEENAIFSVCCEESQSHDDSPASEIGEYELNYLANLYQQTDILSSGCNGADAILPDAVAPPSLGSITSTAPGAHISLDTASSSLHSAPTPSTLSGAGDLNSAGNTQPDTPPRKGPGSQWLSTGSEISSRVPSPVKSSRATTRKRKAAGAEAVPAAVVVRPQRVVAYSEVKVEARDSNDKDSSGSGSDRGESPCPSLSHISEVCEIRPEDDPLGLFTRDPSTLTPEEQRLVKKQRRLLKNRESAQLSRHRKKMHLNSLERQVDVLKKEKASLAGRVQELADENDRLRKQLLAGA